MCKHVAAVLYGVGARLDREPELLFRLRDVDPVDLIEVAVTSAGKKTATRKKTLAATDVADVFGIEIADPAPASAGGVKPQASKRTKAKAAVNAEGPPENAAGASRRSATAKRRKKG
jgi:uncharacterized Zn finger protein